MTPEELSAALATLGLKNAQVAAWFGFTRHRFRSYTIPDGKSDSRSVPPALGLLMRLLLARPELIALVEQLALGGKWVKPRNKKRQEIAN